MTETVQSLAPAVPLGTQTDLAVVVLTRNEERNIAACLRSALRLTPHVLVVDSFSTDATVDIARSFGVPVEQHAWTHWADQRNWAMDNLPWTAEWILFLDADEVLTDALVHEIRHVLGSGAADVNGYYMRRRFVFLGRELRHGGYRAIWVLRLVRRGCARVAPAAGAEYFQVRGRVARLQGHMIHHDRKPLSAWIAKHDQVATLEAEVVGARSGIRGEPGVEVEAGLRYAVRRLLFDRVPLWLTPFLLFTYRYVLRLGFLDGKEGFAYHFLHELWFPLLIALKVQERALESRP